MMILFYIFTNYSIPVGKNNKYGYPNKEVEKVIKSNEYGRLPDKTKNKPIKKKN